MMKTKSFGSIPSPHPVYDEMKSFGSTPLPHPLDATAKNLKWQSISNQVHSCAIILVLDQYHHLTRGMLEL